MSSFPYNVEFVLKNYKCFEDVKPCVFRFETGFTALVGPNNSGKSALLRMLYDMRGLFGTLKQPMSWGRSGSDALQVTWPSDSQWSRLFNFNNERPMSIEIGLIGLGENCVSRIVLHAPRDSQKTMIITQLLAGRNDVRQACRDAGVHGPDYMAQKGIDIGPFVSMAKVLENSLYIGAFRGTTPGVDGASYGVPVGKGFVGEWSRADGGTPEQKDQLFCATESVRRVLGYDQLDVSPSRSGDDLNVTIDGKTWRLSELGSGIAHLICSISIAAIRQPSMLLIDEPENGLHPRVQIDYLNAIGSFATGPTMYATHSQGLARSIADRIYAVERHAGATVVQPFEQPANLVEFLGAMSYSAYAELGCDTILLVEGASEIRCFQQLLRLKRSEHRIVMLHLGGHSLIRDGVEADLAELQRITKRVFAIIDSERRTAGEALEKSRMEFVKACSAVGVEVLVLNRRATENYFPDHAIKAAMGGHRRALEPYEKLKEYDKAWNKRDNWRIARRMTEADLDGTDLGAFLNKL